MGKRILILGASGFIGNALYSELQSYFDVYGTYYSNFSDFSKNQVFYHFDVEKDDVEALLNTIKPSVIISCLGGQFDRLLDVHKQLSSYAMVTPNCRLFFISTVKVFDGIKSYPALETDKAFAISNQGKYALAVEKLLKELPAQRYAIIRLPLVLGVNAPVVTNLKYAIASQDVFEIYPDLVINVTTDTRLSQQIHYLVNQSKYGIFHVGSSDLIHHSDLFEEISEKLGSNKPIFKQVYESNTDRFEAVLPKKSFSLKEHKYNVLDIVNEVTLNQSIPTLKTTLL
ncbi:sugar nucleotide-binding protein [Planktosalinus lacus]|uniref:dTDP-4-dehydrorhamnose reductase n=1 Tax=Planktosalinus lacus TaxID=1526573 RepID=A0A8J2VD98_9FLAO|nr:sugar nucleotide-binding protein [Planktosalinus lacus]GGE00232.1 hypothetical protein GCM10011312_24670 [Planktosalinus lacus]